MSGCLVRSGGGGGVDLLLRPLWEQLPCTCPGSAPRGLTTGPRGARTCLVVAGPVAPALGVVLPQGLVAARRPPPVGAALQGGHPCRYLGFVPVSAPWSTSKGGLAAPSPRAAPRPWPWLASSSAPAPHPVQPSPSAAPALPGDPERPRSPGFPPGRLERASRRWSLSSQGRRWAGHLCWWGVPCRRHAAHHR